MRHNRVARVDGTLRAAFERGLELVVPGAEAEFANRRCGRPLQAHGEFGQCSGLIQKMHLIAWDQQDILYLEPGLDQLLEARVHLLRRRRLDAPRHGRQGAEQGAAWQ
jgi:hypothetical protein